MPDDRDLLPDQRILSEIFPDVPDITTDLCTVLSNTFDTCTFRLKLATEPRPGFSADLIIRLETSGSHLPAVVKLQRLAQLQIPHLVPATLAVGSVTNGRGRQVDYCVTPFIAGTTVLEEVWMGLDGSNQRSLMEALVAAMGQFNKVSIQNPEVQQIIQQYYKKHPESQLLGKASLGSLHTGFYSNIKQLLEEVLEKRAIKSKECDILDTNNGIVVRSAIDGIGEIGLSQSDLDYLMDHIFFCHNDLEPRNILVKQVCESGMYELAAILDWEIAGFFPLVYESWFKDTQAGSSSQWFSWYSLYKEYTAKFVQEESHEKLAKALAIITESQESLRPKAVSDRIRVKWIKRERLTMSSDPRQGWVREEGAGHVPVFTKEDNDNLELEVLKELGYI